MNLEERIPARHPLRKIKGVVHAALVSLDSEFALLYAEEGRPAIAPERLLRASLVQILFSIRSERQLMEQLHYNLLFRWFVGLSIDEPVWVPTVFTKNRDRLLDTEMSQKFWRRSLRAGVNVGRRLTSLSSDRTATIRFKRPFSSSSSRSCFISLGIRPAHLGCVVGADHEGQELGATSALQVLRVPS